MALAGLLCFQRGFFSARETYDAVSNAKSDASFVFSVSSELRALEGAAPLPRFRRVLLFVVDALRIDFVTPGNFPYLHELLAHNATQSCLLTFRADPPTTTSQRLRALAAGSLPAFLDVGNNFHGQVVREDTWLQQLRTRRGNGSGAHFVGDDTWTRLFPQLFSSAAPLASFDTRDLDSVDDGVERLLFPLLEAERARGGDWALVVAHFLGVDHIGHTHSAGHPLMAKRLQRMDGVLRRLVQVLPSDALLLLMGDHGMTDDGNHGGASTQETDAALFAFSPSPGAFPDPTAVQWDAERHAFVPPVSPAAQYAPRVVAQVDLVPSLSLLLGLPVPYSNLGGLVPELLFALLPPEMLVALLSNCLQVLRYLRRAGGANLGAAEVLLDEAMRAHLRLARGGRGGAQQAQAAAAVVARYHSFLVMCLSQARAQWSSLSLPWMLAGLTLAALALALVCPPPSLAALRSPRLQPLHAATLVLSSVHALSTFSNSCVLHEHWLCLGASATLLLLLVLGERSRLTSLGGVLPASLLLMLPRLHLGPASAPSMPHPVEALALVWTLGAGAVLAWRQRSALWSALSPRHEWPALGLACCLLARTPGAPFKMRLQQLALACAGVDALGGLRASAAYALKWGDSSLPPDLLGGALRQLPVLLLLVTPGQGRAFLAAGALGAALWIWLSESRRPPAAWVVALLLSLLGRLLFFASGHRLDFGALQLEAGFTGSDTFRFAPAGCLLALNTLGWDALALLLAVAWARRQQGQGQATAAAARQALRPLVAYRLLLLLAACACCALHRRHLMVWAVFAPKLVFEAAFFALFAALFVIAA